MIDDIARDNLLKDGYCILKNVLDNKEIDNLKNTIRENLEKKKYSKI